VAYFMASLDPPERNAEFARLLGANFPVLSDPGGAVAAAYGVASEKRPRVPAQVKSA
jgi:peroxiredoxin Q/BCP